MAFIHDLPPEIVQEIVRWVLISRLPQTFEDEAQEKSLAALQKHALSKALSSSFIEGLEPVHSCKIEAGGISMTISMSFTARYVIVGSAELIYWL